MEKKPSPKDRPVAQFWAYGQYLLDYQERESNLPAVERQSECPDDPKSPEKQQRGTAPPRMDGRDIGWALGGETG
jgi:hypothetical protein